MTTLPVRNICIVGGGPAGLYLAHLLLQNNTSDERAIHIDVLEKSPRNDTNVNAFGFGLSARHQRCLEEIPGLWPRIKAHSVPVTKGGPQVRIIGRSVLCRELLTRLDELHGSNRCTVAYKTCCQTIDLEQHVVTTTSGQTIHYDLLVGCDGVRSMVRSLLVQEKRLEEEHYLRDTFWKTLPLGPQPSTLDPGAFQPLSHPSLSGAMLPRYPNGHMALLFWKDLTRSNPPGVETPADLAQVLTQAVQPKTGNLARKLLFWRNGSSKRPSDDDESGALQLKFNDKALAQCVDSQPRQEHYIKLDRYHDVDSRVALLGDSAHGMYSFLGQGAACAFQSARFLASSLHNCPNDLPAALQDYSSRAVPQGHAAADLNLVSHVIFGSLWSKLIAVPLLLLNALRGKLLMTRLNEHVPYAQIYQENSWLMIFSRWVWKRHRIPFEPTAAVTKTSRSTS